MKHAKRCVAPLSLALLPGYGWAEETEVTAGLNAGYSYDDNVQVAAVNRISLDGATVGGFVGLQYDMPRLTTFTRLKLGAERYEHSDFDSNDPQLEAPKASDFDNESYDFSSDLAYNWERHTLSFFGLLASDSNINTQFADGGLGGLRQIEGATQVDTAIMRPSWNWKVTERQTVDTSVQAQYVNYESDLYINYNYYSMESTWFYVLNERLQLQVRPLASRYENAAEFAITSDTYGLETGVVWEVSEKWALNVLGGVTSISTDYGRDGFYTFNRTTGQIEFVELETDASNGFTGSAELTFTEERYGFSAFMDSGFSPSSNGYLQESNSARFTFYWKPQERLRFDVDGRLGFTDTTGDQVDNKRTYGEAAFRVGYQFAEEWWLSARYRYREQDYERNRFGSANGNLVSANVFLATLPRSGRLTKRGVLHQWS